MTNAGRLIAVANHHRLLLPSRALALIARTITLAALDGDLDAERWLWLLNWNPQQLVN